MRLNVPAAIRYALGRTNLYSWSFQGCVGYPYGSLLVGKESKSCRGLMFRQLQFKGGPGDPPAGTPVAMFPECDEISDRLDPNAYCVKSSAARSER